LAQGAGCSPSWSDQFNYVMRCFCTCLLFAVLSAVVSCRRAAHSLATTEPRRINAGEDISQSLYEAAIALKRAVLKQSHGDSRTPFGDCGPAFQALPVLAAGPVALNELGFLASGGLFWATDDGQTLVKSIDKVEADELARWRSEHVVSNVYPTCDAFASTLLLPYPLRFDGADGQTWVAMENETWRMERTAGPGWRVGGVFDLKPLPNLSKGLAAILKELIQGLLAGLPHLASWQGWAAVREQLSRDAALLSSAGVVDFSLFAHLLLPTENKGAADPALVPPALSAASGCIVAPKGEAILCLKVLDYLMPYSFFRMLESSVKGQKFDNYSSKFLHAVDCLGDLGAQGCESYNEYLSILHAGSSELKSTFIGTKTFADGYECEAKSPYLVYKVTYPFAHRKVTRTHKEPLDLYTEYGARMVPAVQQSITSMLGDTSYNGTGFSNNLAKAVREIASPESGARVVGPDFYGLLNVSHEQSKAFAARDSGTGWALTPGALARCGAGVKDFATAGAFGFWRKHTDLGNVMWSPSSERVIVARGTALSDTHVFAVLNMRERLCFLDTLWLDCRPIESRRVQFDYKTFFGPLEILLVSPRQYSGRDFQLWTDGVAQGQKCCREKGLLRPSHVSQD